MRQKRGLSTSLKILRMKIRHDVEVRTVSEGYDPKFFKKLRELEADSFWFRARNDLIVWALGRYFPNARNFFEIGCGTGFVLSGISNKFPHLSLCGSDIHISALDFTRARVAGAELFHMDAGRLPFRDKFDIIGAFDVLEHIENDNLVLSQIYGAIRKGGGIIIAVPQHKFLFSRADRDARHFRRYTMRELKEKIGEAGFRVTDMFSFVSLLFPIMMISRLIRHKKDSILNELKPHALVNRAFKRVLDSERVLIRRGIRLPFGGSLFLIAHKM